MNKNGELQNVAGEDIDRYLHPGTKQVSLVEYLLSISFLFDPARFYRNLSCDISLSIMIHNCYHVFFNFLSLDNILALLWRIALLPYHYSCSGQRQAVKFSTSGHELAEPNNGHISSTFLSEYKHWIEHWTASNAIPLSECGWN